MSRASLLESFTLDAEINSWTHGDDSIELRGFVDNIEGTRTVQTSLSRVKKPVSLFKIVVNNGSNSRVRVLFWGEHATRYSPLIRDRSVITIVLGRILGVNSRYGDPNEPLSPLEVYIQQYTTVTVGDVKFEDDVHASETPLVTIEKVPESSGQINVEGYLKQPFAKVTACGGTYGAGVLVSEKFKIQMKVAQYEDDGNLSKGCFLRVLSKPVNPTQGPCYLLIRSMDDITKSTTVASLLEKDLRVLGFQTPKRKREDSNDAAPVKRSPFDSTDG